VHVRLPPTSPTPPSQQQLQLQSPYPYISNPLSPIPSTHSFLPQQQQQYGGFADQDAYSIFNGQQQQQEEGDMFEYADLTNPTTVAISEGTDCLKSINSYFVS
jgi:hypothetical protein